jgi:DNA-binding MarR family transcriptional regulator
MTRLPSASATVSRQDAAIDELRLACGELLGAERRLRARDQHRSGNLTFAQIRALMALHGNDELAAGQLAKQADLNPASVTAMLDHLERDGIIQRRRSTEDRRMCFVSLTAEGRELVETKRALWQQRWREHFAALPAEQLEAAAAALRCMAELFDEL